VKILFNVAVVALLLIMLLLIGAASCQSHTSPQNQQPVEVTSVLGPIPPPNPGGPTVAITLKNVGEEPVTYLKATLELEKAFEFDFVNITPSRPLLPGESSSETRNLIGPGGGFSNGTSYPLTINVTLQNGDTFFYTKQVQIVEPLQNK
jgi:hypothetical protein